MTDAPKINEAFRDAVTSVSFSLTLRKPDVVMMVEIAEGGRGWHLFRAMDLRSVEVGAMRQLVRDGLAFAPDPTSPGLLELTDAGKHAYELLKIAGIVESVLTRANKAVAA